MKTTARLICNKGKCSHHKERIKVVTGTLEFITSKRSLLFLFIQSSAYQPSPWRPSGPWDDNDDDDDNDYDDDDDDDDDGDDADDDFFDAQVVSLIWTLFIITNSNTEDSSPYLNQIHNALVIIMQSLPVHPFLTKSQMFWPMWARLIMFFPWTNFDQFTKFIRCPMCPDFRYVSWFQYIYSIKREVLIFALSCKFQYIYSIKRKILIFALSCKSIPQTHGKLWNVWTGVEMLSIGNWLLKIFSV